MRTKVKADDGGPAPRQLSTTEMKALVDWSVTPPFITAKSGGPNGYEVSNKVRSLPPLWAAHDLVLKAFTDATRSQDAN